MPPGRLALYAATLGVSLVSARAIAGRPPPLIWAVVLLAGYVALILSGVFILRWRVFVDAIVSGPRGARGVALTFDDGPDPVWTRRVLDTLDAHGVCATFFVISHKVEQFPDVVRDMLARGHAIGVHSYDHDRWFALRSSARVRADIARAVDVLARVTGVRPLLFRPPIGHTNPIISRAIDELDLVPVGWTVRGGDACAGATPGAVVARVRRGLRDGAIVALHDAPERGEREPVIVRTLPSILDAIAAARLAVVPLCTWVEAIHQGGDAGKTT
ncbi:MAG: polysaccharide deacetylase family protein [Polyangiaceae bacterium]